VHLKGNENSTIAMSNEHSRVAAPALRRPSVTAKSKGSAGN